jgi:hypothetical protein
MGGILEVAKVTITIWLHEYWHRARLLMKLYLVPAVVLLMIITSMGIFGFLSKAHLDQAVPTGDVQAQVALLDEKIKTQRDNIETARAALKQMDNQVNELLARSADDRGAERAVQIRRQQARERTALQADIARAQAEIAQLNQQRAPVAAELRKVEAEVGPIKYIAALIYGDNPDANLLEKAVRWVIILLVVVFDPLAIMMVLAATESLKWRRETPAEPAYPPDDGPLTDDQLDQMQTTAESDLPVGETMVKQELFPEPEKSTFEQHPYLTKGFVHFENIPPMVAPVETTEHVDQDEDAETPQVKELIRTWKLQNPGQTVKHQREMFDHGVIDQLPWMAMIEAQPDNLKDTAHYMGNDFPARAAKGDYFTKLDCQPTKIFKFNGSKWIDVDKTKTDQYTYNTEYIDWLIEKLAAGEYDPELLTDAEQDQITERVNQTKGKQ